MQRRSFLKGAGVVTILAAGGGVWRLLDQGVFSAGAGPAYQPWTDWRRAPEEGLLGLVRAAILAASPHNTQPWLFRVSDTRIDLYLDPTRNVGALDPFLREAYIGLGCALENLHLAAKAKGSAETITLVPGRLGAAPPGPGPVLVARVEISGCIQEWTELYEAIPRRHTNRGAYLPQRPVPPEFLADLERLAADEPQVRMRLFSAPPERERIVRISAAANAELYADPAVRLAHQRWLRLAWPDVGRDRDGLTVDAFGLSPVQAGAAKLLPSWLLRRTAERQARRGYAHLMASAPLIGVLAVPDRLDKEHCLRAGRVWQRTHLLATARGLAGRPCNEAVEMIDWELASGRPALRAGLLGKLLADPAWQPTFLFYLGYPAGAAPASPRRPLQQVLL